MSYTALGKKLLEILGNYKNDRTFGFPYIFTKGSVQQNTVINSKEFKSAVDEHNADVVTNACKDCSRKEPNTTLSDDEC